MAAYAHKYETENDNKARGGRHVKQITVIDWKGKKTEKSERREKGVHAFVSTVNCVNRAIRGRVDIFRD